MHQIAYFEIQSVEPERLAAFYQAVFGWNFIEQTGLPVRYWRIETEGIAGGLLERPGPTPPPECGTNAYTCSIEVPDFDRAAENILARGGQVAMPKFEIPGRCWQGYFIDPDNNVFGIFEVIGQ
jgi:predicted enzyme related to lactoylglutathione lyase